MRKITVEIKRDYSVKIEHFLLIQNTLLLKRVNVADKRVVKSFSTKLENKK
jgi:hypothetical protein